MSIYLLPKTIVDNLDKQRRKFFWQGGGTREKYHLVRWEIICKNKIKGGLGVKDISKMNISLLCKWWWKLEREDGIWQEIIEKKYLKGKHISAVKHKLDDSPIWADLLKIRQVYLSGRQIQTKNGKNTLFWEDAWLKDKPLYVLHPTLYDWCADKSITISFVLEKNSH